MNLFNTPGSPMDYETLAPPTPNIPRIKMSKDEFMQWFFEKGFEEVFKASQNYNPGLKTAGEFRENVGKIIADKIYLS